MSSRKSNSVLDKLMPLGTIQRRQRQKKESNFHATQLRVKTKMIETFKKKVFFCFLIFKSKSLKLKG